MSTTTNNLYGEQLRILEREMAKVPPDAPNRGLWQSLFHILVALNNIVGGLTERLDSVEGAIKVIQSDTRETKNLVSRMAGGEIQFDEYNHPARRKSDQDTAPQGSADKLLSWFRDRVLPGLVQGLISTAVLLFTLLIINHYLELLPLR